MLKECKLHGYFRGAKCHNCDSEGKFLMNDAELERLGRIMAGCLRHFPERYDLQVDEHGWTEIHRFVDAVRDRERDFHWLRPHHIKAVIETDPKGRYQYQGGNIRATYGHSLDVKLDHPIGNIPDILYYPVTSEEVDIILETGLKPSDRKKVHLSRSVDKALEAGMSRVANPIILAVDTKTAIIDGIVIQRAAPTVFLADEIPPKYLKRLDLQRKENDKALTAQQPSQ